MKHPWESILKIFNKKQFKLIIKMKNSTLDDMIFEHRNKAYGAYVFRKNYKNVLTKSLVIGCSIILFLSMAAFSYLSKNGNNVEKPIYTVVDIIQLKELVVKPELIKPKDKPTAPLQKQVQTIPPVAVPDDSPKTDVIPPTDADKDKFANGSDNIDGPVNSISSLIQAPVGLGDPGPISDPLPTPAVDPPVDDNTIKDFVEIAPMFNGGLGALNKFLSSNLNYPVQAARAGVEGRVIVQFVVEKDGSIGNVKVLKGINFGCDEEAVRVVSKMPKWKAGVQNGAKVRVYYTLPIFFSLVK